MIFLYSLSLSLCKYFSGFAMVVINIKFLLFLDLCMVEKIIIEKLKTYMLDIELPVLIGAWATPTWCSRGNGSNEECHQEWPHGVQFWRNPYCPWIPPRICFLYWHNYNPASSKLKHWPVQWWNVTWHNIPQGQKNAIFFSFSWRIFLRSGIGVDSSKRFFLCGRRRINKIALVKVPCL